jgi:hypothetical protein
MKFCKRNLLSAWRGRSHRGQSKTCLPDWASSAESKWVCRVDGESRMRTVGLPCDSGVHGKLEPARRMRHAVMTVNVCHEKKSEKPAGADSDMQGTVFSLDAAHPRKIQALFADPPVMVTVIGTRGSEAWQALDFLQCRCSSGQSSPPKNMLITKKRPPPGHRVPHTANVPHLLQPVSPPKYRTLFNLHEHTRQCQMGPPLRRLGSRP